MIKRSIIYSVLSLIFGALFYYFSNNLIFSILVLLLYLAFFFLFYERKYRTYKLIINKTRECIAFINNFIITISINKSVNSTFDSLSNSFSDSLVEQINSINHLSDEEKVMYLDNYFQSPLYSAFLKILKQNLYEGGNIIDSAHLLIFDTRIVEENLNQFLSISYKKVFQFCLMWGFCFLILIIMRIFLGSYYVQIQNMTYFPYSLFAFFFVFLVCLWLILSHFLDLRFINEEIKNEKNKNEN